MTEKKTPAKKTPAKKTPAKKPANKKAPAKKAVAKKAAPKKAVAKRPANTKSPAGINTGVLNKTPLKKSIAPDVDWPEPPAPKIYENNVPKPPTRMEIIRRWFRRLR